MIGVQSIDQLADKLAGLVPPGMTQAREDIKANFKDVLAHGLEQMDLVPREQFDVKCRLLEATHRQLEALEKRIEALEQLSK